LASRNRRELLNSGVFGLHLYPFLEADSRAKRIEHRPMKPVRPIKCPSCKKEGNWFDGKYGPFCSHRCKLVDLGKWFSQENRISEPLRPEHLDPFADLPPGQELDQPEKGEE
jgi:endogenous inhibitor of DNA gyrase (YacG/DUF329 family)